MEIKPHYNGGRWRNGSTKIKTKPQPKKKEEEKKETKLERQNSENVRFERAPPGKDAKHSRNVWASNHCTKVGPPKKTWQIGCYFMYINLITTVFVGIVRMDMVRLCHAVCLLSTSISASFRVIVAFSALLNILFSVLWHFETEAKEWRAFHSNDDKNNFRWVLSASIFSLFLF